MRRTSGKGVAASTDGQALARHHQLCRGAQPEPQRAVQPHLLLRLEQPAVAALGDQQLDLFRRVHVPMAGRRHAERRSRSMPLPLRKEMDGPNSRCDHCIGSTVASAVRVGFCSASDFGTSSPMITARHGEDEQHGDPGRRRRGSASIPRTARKSGATDGRERRLAVGAEDQAGKGDADL